mgnify:CR=1 FL=1
MANEIMAVRQLPVIEERLRSQAETVDKRVALAESLVCTEDTYKAVKKTRAELNSEFANFEEQRKAIKKAILDPYERFEATYRECIADKYRAADAALKGKIAEVENGIKDAKREDVTEFFNEYAASLGLDFVSFEAAGINVTMSASKKSLRESARKFLDGIADDLSMISTQEHSDEIFLEYKRTLNAAQAVTTVHNRHAAIEEERRRREVAAAEQAARVQAQMRVEEVLQAETQPEALTPPEMVEPAPGQVETPQETPKVYSMTFTVRGTLNQLRAVKKFLVDGGYDYE